MGIVRVGEVGMAVVERCALRGPRPDAQRLSSARRRGSHYCIHALPCPLACKLYSIHNGVVATCELWPHPSLGWTEHVAAAAAAAGCRLFLLPATATPITANYQQQAKV